MRVKMRDQKTFAALVDQIHAICPPGTPCEDQAQRDSLADCVQDMIAQARAEGRILGDPREIALTRQVTVSDVALRETFAGKTVLVTGAAGCVASALIPRLLGAGAAEIVGIDREPMLDDRITPLRFDIRDRAALRGAFQQTRPQIVFHLAAEREPGRAEKVIHDAIETNVFGTRSVIECCQQMGVERAVYSSTGKCFAYLTDHVYTATKKMSEALWARAARDSQTTRFAFTRFTHLLENGIVFRDIEDGIAAGMVEIHGANRNFNLQNLNQATGLLLQAALDAQAGAARSLVAWDIGWPVNVLDFAVWRIEQTGQKLPLRFLGVPPGYDEVFFRGQFDWSGEVEIHPLINALEHQSLASDATGTIGRFTPLPVPDAAITAAMDGLERMVQQDDCPPETLKATLLDAVTVETRAMLETAPVDKLEQVLAWGTDPVSNSEETLKRFTPIITIIKDIVETRRGTA